MKDQRGSVGLGLDLPRSLAFGKVKYRIDQADVWNWGNDNQRLYNKLTAIAPEGWKRFDDREPSSNRCSGLEDGRQIWSVLTDSRGGRDLLRLILED